MEGGGEILILLYCKPVEKLIIGYKTGKGSAKVLFVPHDQRERDYRKPTELAMASNFDFCATHSIMPDHLKQPTE